MKKERIEELFTSQDGALMICVGSWYAYNSCNSHALGSFYNGHYYINFSLLEDGEELIELLKALGWTSQEIEELFIQDYDGDDWIKFNNCDYINPYYLANQIAEHRDEIEDNKQLIAALFDVGIYSGLDELLEDADDAFNNYIYYDESPEDYMREITEDSYNIPDALAYYIDYEAMARDEILSGYIEEANGGTLVRL